MDKRKWLLCGVCVLAVSMVLTSTSGLFGAGRVPEPLSGARTDVIRIDAMTVFGALEKPPVEFLHDAHTQALANKNRDCTACHLTQNDRIAPKFKRLDDSDRITVMNLYHQGCISCHGEMKAAREKTGPVDCDDCHTEQSRFSSSRRPVGFDKSLHFRHSEAQQNKCDRCHHEYDETTKKLFYTKGNESTCRYCHLSETKENRISMRAASHLACIDCHRKNQLKSLHTGPVECLGCHDAAAQRKIEKVESVPRMEGKQPDVALLKRSPKSDPAGNQPPNRMRFVPFDHKAHETYNNSCRICHHESLKACNECHTVTGAKQGKGVNLERAMHQVDTQKSCRGCHLSRQSEKNCAGCHVFISARLENNDASCRPCHNAPVRENEASPAPDQDKALAAQLLQARAPITATYDQRDIPETVTIKDLSNQYESVQMPHRKIVNALAGNIKDSNLAAYFHADPGTLCQGCHHHSPVSSTPPRCANCHGRTLDAQTPLKPGIMGAYHLQCMGCHKAMGIEKPAGCIECHKEKS
jgi:hypothetical protein